MSKKQLFHFVGSHRTGSKSQAAFFSRYLPNTIGIHQRTSQQWLNLISNFYAAGWMPRVMYRWLVNKLLINWIDQQDSEYVVETNGFNLIALELLLEHFPNMRMVHVVRDPRSFIRSLINFRKHSAVRRFIIIHLPFWELKAHYLGKTTFKEWLGLSEAERITWQWRVKNEYIIDRFSDLPNYIQVNFEELYNPNSDTFSSVLSFLGVRDKITEIAPFYGDQVNSSRDSGYPDWQTWDAEFASNVDSICGDLMRKLGYGHEEDWSLLTSSTVVRSGS
jgi:hypothetical protein